MGEPGRFPLKISGDKLPSGLKLVKATKPVEVVDGRSRRRTPCLPITEIDVQGDKASVRYRYDIEGIRGNVTLAKSPHVKGVGRHHRHGTLGAKKIAGSSSISLERVPEIEIRSRARKRARARRSVRNRRARLFDRPRLVARALARARRAQLGAQAGLTGPSGRARSAGKRPGEVRTKKLPE